MIKTLKLSFQISITYSVNSFIYWLQRTPLLKKIVPKDLIQKNDIKDAIRILVILFKGMFSLITKLCYAFFFFYFFFHPYEGNSTTAFLLTFFFLSVIGAALNSTMVTPTKEKYHVVILMRMDAKRYALTTYLSYLAEIFVTFLLSFFVLSFFLPFLIPFVPLLAVWVCLIKVIGDGLLLFYYERNGQILKNKLWFSLIIIVVGLSLAYGLPHLAMNLPWFLPFCLFFLTIMGAIYSGRYIWGTDCYTNLYKKTVTMNAIVFDVDESSVKARQQQVAKFSKEISEKTEQKKGYDYFNAIFFERHKKILLNSAIKFALVYLVIVGIVGCILYFDKESSISANKALYTMLPYFVFVMYFTNRGTIITQAMFFNCDHSMLTYQFYRTPQVILHLFWARLKMLVKINLIPAVVIACGIPFLLFLTGGASGFDYFLFFISILLLSTFFSVHYLVLYYLLQPYDVQMKQKSATYNIVTSFTYMVCYFCLQIKVPLFSFSILVLFFSLSYILIALYLVYKKASKTFRIRL